MINKNVIERLKKGKWVIYVKNGNQLAEVVFHMHESNLDYSSIVNETDNILSYEKPNIGYCDLFTNRISFNFSKQGVNDLRLENITDWFFENINNDPEREHLHNILNAWIDGEEIESSCFEGCWINQTETLEGELAFKKGNKYRIKPKATPLPIPDELWRFIKPEFKYVAMDSDCGLYLYKSKPTKLSYCWDSDGSEFVSFLIINTDGIDWRLSLTERPSEVNHES